MLFLIAVFLRYSMLSTVDKNAYVCDDITTVEIVLFT